MSTQNPTIRRFRPERPIVLNEQNTNLKTKDEVILKIEDLRNEGWLCTYGERMRPFHMSFNDEKMFQEFKKDCSALNVTLKSPVIKSEDLEALEEEETKGTVIPGAEAVSTYEDPSGRVHIQRLK